MVYLDWLLPKPKPNQQTKVEANRISSLKEVRAQLMKLMRCMRFSEFVRGYRPSKFFLSILTIYTKMFLRHLRWVSWKLARGKFGVDVSDAKQWRILVTSSDRNHRVLSDCHRKHRVTFVIDVLAYQIHSPYTQTHNAPRRKAKILSKTLKLETKPNNSEPTGASDALNLFLLPKPR